jgi:hypothetical protein
MKNSISAYNTPKFGTSVLLIACQPSWWLLTAFCFWRRFKLTAPGEAISTFVQPNGSATDCAPPVWT